MGFGSVISIYGNVSSLDVVPDGVSYRKVTGVDALGRLTSNSIGTGAIGSTHIGAAVINSTHIGSGQIGPALTSGYSGTFVASSKTFTVTNGLITSAV